jgi:hypothetical protein
MTKVVLFQDFTGEEFTLDMPLTSKINPTEIKEDLGIPAFIQADDFVMERAMIIAYALSHAHKMHDLHPEEVPKNFGSDPIPALFFGGVSIRLHSPSSNDRTSPFFRSLNDIDLIAPKERGRDLIQLLSKLGEIYGSKYYHFVTKSDTAFNAMRGGSRYRIRTVEKIADDGTPISGILDILTDSVDLRHLVDVREDFKTPARNLYTISLANILLTKCQFIFDLPASANRELSQAHFEYRVLNYPYLKSSRIVIGMEQKDILDVCALVLDNQIGDAPGLISTERIKRVLERDKKFALTFRLNLQNILDKPQILEALQVDKSTISKIMGKLEEILGAVPAVEKKWSSPWWNIDVETPQIFGKTPV